MIRAASKVRQALEYILNSKVKKAVVSTDDAVLEMEAEAAYCTQGTMIKKMLKNQEFQKVSVEAKPKPATVM